MRRIKPGARIYGIRPEVFFALSCAESLLQKRGTELTITCGIDGTHKQGSLHYTGAAADIRSKDLHPDAVIQFVKDLKERLGVDFDVVQEEDHVHIEFEPKQSY